MKFQKSGIFLIIFFLGIGYFAFAGSEHNVSGYAWSETIGWISFNSTNQGGGVNYGVDVSSDGKISGYAWSENIGWLSFNESELSGCPSGACRAELDYSTGKVLGWAKALSMDPPAGGWDGWISLSGSNYGVTVSDCAWDGYAWGSDVVGWIHFKGSNYGVVSSDDACAFLTADLTVNPSSGFEPLSSTLTGSVSGTVTGTVNYNFWWDCSSETTDRQTAENNCGNLPGSSPGSCVSNSNGAKCDGISESSQDVGHTYNSVGAYTAKVITERGSFADESRKSVTVDENPEDFSLNASPGSIIAKTEAEPTVESNKSTIKINDLNGFNETVSLSVDSVTPGLSGATFYFDPASLTPSQYDSGSKFWVTVPNDTPEDTYAITIKGEGGGLVRSTTVNLEVDQIKTGFEEF